MTTECQTHVISSLWCDIQPGVPKAHQSMIVEMMHFNLVMQKKAMQDHVLLITGHKQSSCSSTGFAFLFLWWSRKSTNLWLNNRHQHSDEQNSILDSQYVYISKITYTSTCPMCLYELKSCQGPPSPPIEPTQKWPSNRGSFEAGIRASATKPEKLGDSNRQRGWFYKKQ